MASALFNFFRMSGDNWEIKWVLRTTASSVEAESNLVYFCRATVNLARNCSLVFV